MKIKPLSFNPRSYLVRTAVWLVLWTATVLFYEFLLHLVVFGRFTANFLYVVGFSLSFGAFLALILSFFPRKVNFYITIGIMSLMLLFYGSQMVYNFVFGSLYSVSLIQEGGAAITSFWRETLMTMWEHLPLLLVLFVPVVLLVVFRKFFLKWLAPVRAFWKITLGSVAVFVFFVTLLCLPIGGTGFFSTHYFYHSNETTTDQAAERFGLLTAFRLEFSASAAPAKPGGSDDDYYIPPEDNQENPGSPEVEPPKYNVLNLDFDALSKLTDNQLIQELNKYCDSLSGTKQNEYTGMLKDYNLIYICAESFSTAAIVPELMPTLYKLSTQGFIFNNYYNTFPNVTTDGEYTMCLGLYPDVSRNKQNASFKASVNNYLPYALGNIFTQQKGIKTYGYHNYTGSYYNRRQTHANMGYSMKFMNDGMKFTSNWPSSDYEMMQQSVGDYIGQEQFHAYYMTFSGHYQYNPETNLIAKRNWDLVKDMPYSTQAKAYISCHIELEKALAYLMEQLETAGVADKTAIVLAGDHFPYGLKDKQYSELIGYTIDDFSKYKSSLLFWVGGMEESIEIDTYCCNADILPTVLNLWGFEYDSRMLAGTDILSDGTHIAILRDYSFYTDKVWFNASKNKIKYLVDESTLPAGYVENMIKLVKTKYKISVDILNSDYYKFIYDNLPSQAQ